MKFNEILCEVENIKNLIFMVNCVCYVYYRVWIGFEFVGNKFDVMGLIIVY